MSNFNNSTNSRECWVFSLKAACLTLVVFVGVIGGSASLADAVSKSKNWISVTGQVIALKDCGESCTRKSNGNDFCSNTYAAIIEYMTEDGKMYQFTQDDCTEDALPVGRVIKVLYDPENEGKAVEGSFTNLYLASIIFLPLGIICCGYLCVICYKKFSNMSNVGPSAPQNPFVGQNDTTTQTPIQTYAEPDMQSNENPIKDTYGQSAYSTNAPTSPTQMGNFNSIGSHEHTSAGDSNTNDNNQQFQRQSQDKNGKVSLFDEMQMGM